MFTGIIEDVGIVVSLEPVGNNISFLVKSRISGELSPDQSVNHNGVCLTIEESSNGVHLVTAIAETLEKTNLKHAQPGDLMNLERSMVMNGRLDGHIVQGHVDTTAQCLMRRESSGSTEFTFAFDKKFAHLIVEKGSVCVNGISLTAFNITADSFTVAIIPF